ncbi:MAG: transporter [Caulobacterales bacterium]|nr:transporter [Caulobacterales bacterium]MCA0372251.1 transporter [Pseudomonadota bacterium]
MLAIKQFQETAKGMPDLLNWAALIDDGIVLGKDGSLMAGFYYRGSDLASATPEEKNYISARINAAMCQLGSGWVSWHDAIRLPAEGYPAAYRSSFPDRISELIDEERRQHFMTEGEHFESEYVLILMYTPPLRRDSKIQDYLYDEDENLKGISPASKILDQFKKAINEMYDRLGNYLSLRRMKSFEFEDENGRKHLRDDLVNYLQFCLTGELNPVNIPPIPMYMDAYVGNVEAYVGDTPKIGDNFIACVAIDGFPAESYVGILDILDHLPITYRWSSRFIYLEQYEAVIEINKYRRQWKQKVRGFWAQMFRTEGGVIDEDALMMQRESEGAIADANSGVVLYGYYTPVVVIYAKSSETALDNARLVSKQIRREGFSARIETINAMEAYLGALPGHPIPNVRRPFLHTLSLTDLVPLSSVWAGRENNPCPFYPTNSPPLLHAATSGTTPFRLNLHIGDVGHTLIFGPTGAGKSTLLGLIAAQFRRYPKAKITAFDKGRSMMPLALATGGKHYDIASDVTSINQIQIGMCPLAYLESDNDVAWANDWLSTLFELQTNRPPSPNQREAIYRAIKLMQANHDENGNPSHQGRTMTDFLATVQDEEIRAALSFYTLQGSMGHLLDNDKDELTTSTFSVFEIEELMAMGEKSLIPVLLYLFRRFERSLDGSPAMLILDEAWVMLGHPTFREKIREWLKVLRKANCTVVLATQSLSDAVKSGILDILLEACPTKILLPNEEADKSGTENIVGPRDLYKIFGMNDAQIEIIRSATKKKHYYFVSPEGRRLFDLNLGPIALSFVGVSDKEQLTRIRELAAKYGDDWPYQWLKERNVKL